ncbi:hypothetical protein MCAMS1_02782 [biofilm metagenome]
MFKAITHFFERYIVINVQDEDSEEKIRVASAALFMEMMHAEEICSGEKLQLIATLVENNFNLTEEQTLALMAIAEQKRQQATDYFEFTHLINDGFSREQKIHLIEALWKIALVDNHLEIDEEYLIDKIARLLIIPRPEVLQAKIRAAG